MVFMFYNYNPFVFGGVATLFENVYRPCDIKFKSCVFKNSHLKINIINKMPNTFTI